MSNPQSGIPGHDDLAAGLRLVACPDCGVPAEIADASTVQTTAGPWEIVRVRCVLRHQFLMPATKLTAL